MKKKNKNNNIILFSIIGIVLVILILIIIFLIPKKSNKKDNFEGIYILPGIPEDKDRVKVSNHTLNKEQCVEDICVRNVVINCYSDKGGIEYQITNKGKEKKTGYLKMEFDNFTATIVYQDLEKGKYVDGYSGYSGYDLRKVKSYRLKKLSDSDYQSIVK